MIFGFRITLDWVMLVISGTRRSSHLNQILEGIFRCHAIPRPIL